MSEKSYSVIRFYETDAPEVIKRGRTLGEAQEHCRDPETSSRTATTYAARARTKQKGQWFDGYREEQ